MDTEEDFYIFTTVAQVKNRLKELDNDGGADAITKLNAELRIAQILSNEG